MRWPELTGLRGRIGGDALLAALPEVDGVHVLAASRERATALPAEAVTAVVEAARAAGWRVVVDLPRSGCGCGGSAADVVLADADLVALLVPARVRAVSAARSLLASADGSTVPWAAAQLVVRELPGGLPAAEVSRVLGRPVLATLPHDRGAVGRAERGEPPSVAGRAPLGVLARRLLAELPTGGAA